jgi:hypothetical protein
MSTSRLEPIPIRLRKLPRIVVGHVERQARRSPIECLVPFHDRGKIGFAGTAQAQR